jgi:putative PIN family toxin of toxin-antitoxin system
VTGGRRVVLDTNVVLSTLVFAQGPHAPLRYVWQREKCLPLVSRATTEELLRVLAYPEFRLTAEEQQELLADYIPYCETVQIPMKPPRTPACRDPFDVPFLQLAVAGKASCLVTSDRDLLVIGRRLSCPIMTPERFLAMPEYA